jgi:ABC-type cobalt transport system substrate-binding protein
LAGGFSPQALNLQEPPSGAIESLKAFLSLRKTAELIAMKMWLLFLSLIELFKD